MRTPDRDLKANNEKLSESDKEVLQAQLEALIITMDKLAVKDISVAPINVHKNGGRVTLLPLKP